MYLGQPWKFYDGLFKSISGQVIHIKKIKNTVTSVLGERWVKVIGKEKGNLGVSVRAFPAVWRRLSKKFREGYKRVEGQGFGDSVLNPKRYRRGVYGEGLWFEEWSINDHVLCDTVLNHRILLFLINKNGVLEDKSVPSHLLRLETRLTVIDFFELTVGLLVRGCPT